MAALSAALVVVGLPFVVQWARARGTDPASFGTTVAEFVVAGIALALIVGARTRRWRGTLLSFGLLVAAAGGAVIIASRSDAIMAEGVIAAMTLPLGLLAAGLLTSLVGTGLARCSARGDIRLLGVFATLVALSAVVAWRLPVVQFVHAGRAEGIYLVHGGWFAFLGGIAAGAVVGPMRPRWYRRWITLLIPAAAMLGYTLQASFGAALAVLGVCVAMPVWKERIPLNGRDDT